MLKLGQSNLLKVLKKELQGYYLDGGEEWGTILLPNKNAPKNIKIGDEVDVFIYFDSEDIIIATAQKPLAQVGDFAPLKVVTANDIGIFLDLGIDKDLFVPFREQIFKMEPGKSYVVYVYVDNSSRLAATTRLNKHLKASGTKLETGQTVDLLIYQQTDMGFKAIINNKYSGLIFKDDLTNHLKLGSSVKGFIKNIRSDGKVDLSLRPLAKESKRDLTDKILLMLKDSGGTLNISSKSSAEIINSTFNVSRKKFKIALGDLYKKELISTDNESITLIRKK